MELLAVYRASAIPAELVVTTVSALPLTVKYPLPWVRLKVTAAPGMTLPYWSISLICNKRSLPTLIGELLDKTTMLSSASGATVISPLSPLTPGVPFLTARTVKLPATVSVTVKLSVFDAAKAVAVPVLNSADALPGELKVTASLLTTALSNSSRAVKV